MSEEACKLPPAGWRCTREAGHEGPCAALPVLKQAKNTLPNGWPQPTFMSVNDGCFSIEWCFDHKRVSFWYDGKEGATTLVTRHEGQLYAQDADAPAALAAILDSVAESSKDLD